MKFKASMTDLLAGLNLVVKTLGTESAGHQGVRVFANQKTNRVKFTTTDGHHVTETWVDATVEKAGKSVIKADKLKPYLEKLDVNTVTISTKTNGSVLLKSTRGQQTFVSYDEDQFPQIKNPKENLNIRLAGKVFKEMVDSVSFCTKKADAKSSDKLEGINMVSDGTKLSMYATDGISVSAITRNIKTDVFNIIVAKKSLESASKQAKPNEKVVLKVCDNKVIVKIDSTTYHIPVLNGAFPCVERIIPAEKLKSTITIERSELLKLLERSSVILKEKNSQVIKGSLQLSDGKLILEGKQQGVNFHEHLKINGKAEDIDVNFDINRLCDIVRNIGSDVIHLNVKEKKPIVIRPDGNNRHTCLLAVG